MPNWNTVVRARLREISGEPPHPEVVEEFALHLAQVCEAAREDGASEADAEARALALLEASSPLLQALQARRAPAVTRLHEWTRQEPPTPATGGFMSRIDLTRDIRFALRMLVRTPAFSLIAVLTFAVGIGVNTAVFSVVNGVLLRALPYPDADRIAMIWLDNRRDGIKDDITSYPNYLDWREQSKSFEHMAGVSTTSFTLTGAGEPERLVGAATTANFFDVMGVQAAMGRVFTDKSEVPGQDAVAVLSHGLWQRRFGGAADVLGRTIALGGRPHEIIGVMPKDLAWPRGAELWVPLAPEENLREARGSFWLPVMGRLKPGVPVEQAQAEMSGISSRMEDTYPSNRGFGANVVPLKREIVGDIERSLVVLMGAVGFVLLIACANLTNLMLGRTAARRKELAIRMALGAGRARVVRQVVTEALVLAGLGGSAGVALAYWAMRAFLAIGKQSIPRPESIAIDAGVMAFAFGIATLAALLSAIVPALQAARAAVQDRLREGGRQGSGTAGHRTRSALVAAEVALAFVLLMGAGLLVRTLWTMQAVDRGFSADHVAVATVSPPAASYANAAAVQGFYTRLLGRLRSAPGVESVALATRVLQPVVTTSGIFSVEGKPLPPPEERVEYPYEVVTPGFFETLRIGVVRGRSFSEQDHADAPRAVVINETLARTGWPGQDPIGRRIRSGGDNSQSPWMTVVGVIPDIHRGELQRAVRPELYMCALQVTPRTQMIVARTAGDPSAILPTLRREVQAIDPQLPLFRAGTLEGQIADTLNQPAFQATLSGAFAVIALLLASIGIYGVTSHAVGQRTQEVGIRMALGASRQSVLRLVLRQHLAPALAGLVAGIAGAFLLSRYLGTLLYGVGATDPATFAGTALALLAVALIACWIPARRATAVDPLVALRAE